MVGHGPLEPSILVRAQAPQQFKKRPLNRRFLIGYVLLNKIRTFFQQNPDVE